MKTILLSTLLFTAALSARAEIKTETVTYKHGSQVLEGFLAYDTEQKGPRPGVIVVHEWMGLGDHARNRARELASMGYVALAADIFGKGVRPADAKEAAAVSGKYKNDRKLLRERANAAHKYLVSRKEVDRQKTAAIGFCFGGTAVLELARAGAPVKGVVSFHGGLDSPKPEDAKNIKAQVLVLHGAVDPYVKPAEVQAFQKEMEEAGVDYQFIAYSGAVHSFTNREAGNDPSKGAAYDETADRRSWAHMKQFFDEILK